MPRLLAVLPGAGGQTCFDEPVEVEAGGVEVQPTCAATSLTPKGDRARCSAERTRARDAVTSTALVTDSPNPTTTPRRDRPQPGARGLSAASDCR
jgi:hypothetical protein